MSQLFESYVFKMARNQNTIQSSNPKSSLLKGAVWSEGLITFPQKVAPQNILNYLATGDR